MAKLQTHIKRHHKERVEVHGEDFPVGDTGEQNNEVGEPALEGVHDDMEMVIKADWSMWTGEFIQRETMSENTGVHAVWEQMRILVFEPLLMWKLLGNN